MKPQRKRRHLRHEEENAVSKGNERNYWVMQVPVISTRHLAKTVMEKLDETLPGEDFHGIQCILGKYGAMLSSADLDNLAPGAPGCLRDVLEWGRSEGFDWIRVDGCGDEIGGLPEYPW